MRASDEIEKVIHEFESKNKNKKMKKTSLKRDSKMKCFQIPSGDPRYFNLLLGIIRTLNISYSR